MCLTPIYSSYCQKHGGVGSLAVGQWGRDGDDGSGYRWMEARPGCAAAAGILDGLASWRVFGSMPCGRWKLDGRCMSCLQVASNCAQMASSHNAAFSGSSGWQHFHGSKGKASACGFGFHVKDCQLASCCAVKWPAGL